MGLNLHGCGKWRYLCSLDGLRANQNVTDWIGDGFTIMFFTVRVPGSLIHYFADAAICKGGGIGLTLVYFFDVVRGPGVSATKWCRKGLLPDPPPHKKIFANICGLGLGRVGSETIIMSLNTLCNYFP
jgi:hypothetical protein